MNPLERAEDILRIVADERLPNFVVWTSRSVAQNNPMLARWGSGEIRCCQQSFLCHYVLFVASNFLTLISSAHPAPLREILPGQK